MGFQRSHRALEVHQLAHVALTELIVVIRRQDALMEARERIRVAKLVLRSARNTFTEPNIVFLSFAVLNLKDMASSQRSSTPCSYDPRVASRAVAICGCEEEYCTVYAPSGSYKRK